MPVAIICQRAIRTGLVAALFCAASSSAFAVTDEIQVYTGEIAPVGVLGLTWHNNYTVNGLKTPDFPGGLVDNHALSSVTEWAYGVTPWFEAGLYLPLFSDTSNQGFTFNGFKLRALFVQPDNAEKDFYYGVNFEFSWNQRQWDTQVNTGEIRPILGYRWGEDRRWSFTFNPIVDNSYKGGIAGLEFVPSARLDYAIDNWNTPNRDRALSVLAKNEDALNMFNGLSGIPDDPELDGLDDEWQHLEGLSGDEIDRELNGKPRKKKKGFFKKQGPLYTGRQVVVDIGIPEFRATHRN